MKHVSSPTPRRLRPSDGSEVWDARAGSMIRGTLALQGRTLWSADEKHLNRVNAVETGGTSPRWSYPLPEAQRPRRIVGDGNRVFVMNDQTLYALPVA